MAYTLQSFLQILEKDQHHLILESRHQIESLLEQTRTLRDSLESVPRIPENLENRIRDAVHEVEDIVESHIRSQLIPGFEHQGPADLDLTNVMHKFNSIREAMFNTPVDMQLDTLPPQQTYPIPNVAVVGFDEDVTQLWDQLTGLESSLQIIPLVGMGGTGKTTLAQEIYNHSFMNHFDIYAWITITQNFDVRAALVTILNRLRHCISHKMDKKYDDRIDEYVCKIENDDQVGVYVHKMLKGRRYLIVVDNIWDTDAWDKLKLFFPDDNNRSRILITTREWNFVNHINPRGNYVHSMHFLNEGDSLRLLLDNVFGQENQPPELVEIGRRIANNCGGLPLAIIVTAGHLCQSEKTVEFWESVAENFRSESTELGARSLEILCQSYNHLPYRLKPCFLYMAAFPDNHEIQASRVINLWIAEGIIKAVADCPLEYVAEGYLNDLIDRNLLSVCEVESDGKVRAFRIHQLLRELCRIKAVDERFLCYRNYDLEIMEGESVRRVSVHPSYLRNNEMERDSFLRSFLCFGCDSSHPPFMSFGLRLLRVLDVFQLEFGEFPTEIEHLINLRYLSLSCNSEELLPHIYKFLNLQTLIIRFLFFTQVSLPYQVWEMKQLMHIKFKEAFIKYKPQNGQHVEPTNIETLSNVEAFGISELLRRAPKLRKLGIYHDRSIDNHVIDLATYVRRLEKLKCSSVIPSTGKFLSLLNLPDSLRKLTVNRCKIPVKFITEVGSLPHLEQLKLQESDFMCEEGESAEPRWEPAEEGFIKLISLVMEDLNLVHWVVDDTSFSVLERLEIRGCSSMEEISLEIGSTPTLELIQVDQASKHLLDSVREMQKQQEKFTNDSLIFDLPQEI